MSTDREPADLAKLYRTVRLIRRFEQREIELVRNGVIAGGIYPPPKRVTRPDGAVLPFARELHLVLQPSRDQLRAAGAMVAKSRRRRVQLRLIRNRIKQFTVIK